MNRTHQFLVYVMMLIYLVITPKTKRFIEYLQFITYTIMCTRPLVSPGLAEHIPCMSYSILERLERS